MPVTPEKLAESNTEDGNQAALFCYFANLEIRAKYPETERLLFAVPNGGWRDPREAAKLKATGTKAGTSDIILLVPRAGYHGFVLELKKLGNHKRDPEQLKFIDEAKAQGFCGGVAEGWRQGVEWLCQYLDLPRA